MLLTDRESAALLHVAVSTFRRYVTKGLVPPPIKLGGASRWPQSEILAVIEAAKDARAR
ncbi:helix-turn-helix transcriptional regulator [Rubellimicrobium roseum]|uniref:helix-turn-helix transcriptional regulator n=1 Tax=Rubellimicrobium roseum TaxID=687525 RepID=UPI001FEA0DFA|nr:helix-turn-helix domain-containing protein [Rubellimicrobium roseum]